MTMTEEQARELMRKAIPHEEADRRLREGQEWWAGLTPAQQEAERQAGKAKYPAGFEMVFSPAGKQIGVVPVSKSTAPAAAEETAATAKTQQPMQNAADKFAEESITAPIVQAELEKETAQQSFPERYIKRAIGSNIVSAEATARNIPKGTASVLGAIIETGQALLKGDITGGIPGRIATGFASFGPYWEGTGRTLRKGMDSAFQQDPLNKTGAAQIVKSSLAVGAAAGQTAGTIGTLAIAGTAASGLMGKLKSTFRPEAQQTLMKYPAAKGDILYEQGGMRVYSSGDVTGKAIGPMEVSPPRGADISPMQNLAPSANAVSKGTMSTITLQKTTTQAAQSQATTLTGFAAAKAAAKAAANQQTMTAGALSLTTGIAAGLTATSRELSKPASAAGVSYKEAQTGGTKIIEAPTIPASKYQVTQVTFQRPAEEQAAAFTQAAVPAVAAGAIAAVAAKGILSQPAASQQAARAARLSPMQAPPVYLGGGAAGRAGRYRNMPRYASKSIYKPSLAGVHAFLTRGRTIKRTPGTPAGGFSSMATRYVVGSSFGRPARQRRSSGGYLSRTKSMFGGLKGRKKNGISRGYL